jgi:hypothetical protein
MKKKAILGIIFFAIAHLGFSQVFIGGSLSYQHSDQKIDNSSTKSDKITISPLIGYRFGKADLGLSFVYGNDSGSNYEISDIGFGIFGDYNFFTADKFSILGRAGFQYTNMKDIYLYPNAETNLNLHVIGINISPYFEYKLLERLTLYTSIGGITFNHRWGNSKKSGDESIETTIENYNLSNFGISLSNGITLGFYVFF